MPVLGRCAQQRRRCWRGGDGGVVGAAGGMRWRCRCVILRPPRTPMPPSRVPPSRRPFPFVPPSVSVSPPGFPVSSSPPVPPPSSMSNQCVHSSRARPSSLPPFALPHPPPCRVPAAAVPVGAAPRVPRGRVAAVGAGCWWADGQRRWVSEPGGGQWALGCWAGALGAVPVGGARRAGKSRARGCCVAATLWRLRLWRSASAAEADGGGGGGLIFEFRCQQREYLNSPPKRQERALIGAGGRI